LRTVDYGLPEMARVERMATGGMKEQRKKESTLSIITNFSLKKNAQGLSLKL